MSGSTLMLRADAAVAIGTGHVMRCLALAQAWQDRRGRVVFAMAATTPALRARITAQGGEVIEISSAPGTTADATETIAAAREQAAGWVAIDGYHFNGDYQKLVRDSGPRVMVLDDHGHAGYYAADLVLNQNLFANASLYESRDWRTRLLLGPRYCLLRREFLPWRDWKRVVPAVGRRVLVTMGGSDPANITTRVVDALRRTDIDGLEAMIVVGGSNPHPEFGCLSMPAGRKISVQRDVTNISELMAWADAAISSAGTTCWELSFLALPSLLVDVAENQTASAQELARRGCAIHVGNAKSVSAEQLAGQLETLLRSERTRGEMSVQCRALVDGKGAERVVRAMRAVLRLRPVLQHDCRLFWDWVNDPAVRAAAFSSGCISWEQHKFWFARKMKDPNCRIFVAENDEGRPVGQFRVDWRSEHEGDIDVSVAPDFRGAGMGSTLIELGTTTLLAERGERLHAFVKVENQVSRRAFEEAGFVSVGEEVVQGHASIHYVRGRTQNPR